MSLIFVDSQADDGDSKPINFGQHIENAWVVQGGFSTGYSSNDHNIKTVEAIFEDVTSGPEDLDYTAKVQINDDSNHSGGGTLYAMGIGQTEEDPTQFASEDGWKPNDGKVTVTIEGQTRPVDQAWVFIKSWKLSYGDTDHHVKTIEIDAGNSNLKTSSARDSEDLYTWTIEFTPTLKMEDDAGNNQDNDDSYLDLLVMAVPED